MSTSNKTSRSLPNLILQEERLARGWTQQEVANRVGTTVVNVSRWERGITSPNPYFRQKLCALFEKDTAGLGLLALKHVPQSETSQAVADGTPDLPAKEEFVATPHKITPLSLRKRLLHERRATVAVVSTAFVFLAGGSGFLIHSLPFLHPASHTGITPAPMLVSNLIAEDTFQRANQTFWGTASDGLQWMGDANTSKNFSIANNTARVATSNGEVFNAVLGARASDAEVLVRGSLSDFNDSNLGAVLRWQGANHWYKAYIDGRSLVIQKKVVAADSTQGYLSSPAFLANDGESYTIRFRVVGTYLWAKAWPTASHEPSGWMATAQDNSYTEGFSGVRIQVHNGSVATISSFQATSLYRETH
jgi:transcriptional regulator with XRE-family HTH domain